MEFKTIRLTYLEETKTLRLDLVGRAFMSIDILSELGQVIDLMKDNDYKWHGKKINVFLMSSAINGIFNLGGDLETFTKAAMAKDRETLQNYGDLCVKLLIGVDDIGRNGIVTIAFVKGHAYGGGFEAALCFQFILAERQAKMGFPEIKFNLYPGMGAFTFLSRRIPVHQATRLLIRGRIESAETFHKMGIVDEVFSKGEGEAGVQKFIRRVNLRNLGTTKILALEQKYHPLVRSELNEIVTDWVDTALQNDRAGLKVMQKIYMTQKTRIQEIVDGNKSTILKMKIYDWVQSVKQIFKLK